MAMMNTLAQEHVDSAALTAGRFAHPGRNIAALGIEPGMNIADFGAGSGAYTLEIAQVLGHAQLAGHVYAVDVQKDLLRRIKTLAQAQKLDTIDVLHGDLEKPGGSKIAEHAVDLVLISNLLFQLEDKKAPVREAARILKEGGRLAIIDWEDSFGGLGPIQAHVFKRESALALSSECGFILEREFPAGAHHYGFIFRKIRSEA